MSIVATAFGDTKHTHLLLLGEKKPHGQKRRERGDMLIVATVFGDT